jgi:hypothetical protein
MGGVKPARVLISCALVVGGAALAGCSSPVPAACADSMSTAAEATDAQADTALVATLSECRTVDDWVAALKEHPSVGALTSYSTSDAHDVLNLVCLLGPDTIVCGEAAERDLLDFDLDDPRLRELDE